MTNPSQTIQNYEVHCSNCGWWGMLSQLKLIRVLVGRDDVTSEPGCPICLSGSLWLEEDDNISSLEIALANLEQADAHFKQAMENLRCQIYQQQS